MGRAAVNKETGVTAQQEKFAVEFVKTGRPSVAYRRAYSASGMQPETVATSANELINNPNIAARIQHYQKIAEARLEVTVERIALEAARIAFFDMRELVDENGNSIPLHELPEDTARALNGLDIEELFVGQGDERIHIGRVKKYKQVPKMDALRLLAQWKKMLIELKESGKPGEFAALSDEELEREARETLQEAVKGGFVKVLPSVATPKAKSKAA